MICGSESRLTHAEGERGGRRTKRVLRFVHRGQWNGSILRFILVQHGDGIRSTKQNPISELQ
jgi:hypothetical protein